MLHGLNEMLLLLNNNKILWGVSMIMLNMGSKYVLGDLGKVHDRIMQNEFFKKIVLLSMFFVATRDVITSFLLTVLYTILVDGIFHESRNFTIVTVSPETTQSRTDIDTNNNIDVKPKEDIYQRYIQSLSQISHI